MINKEIKTIAVHNGFFHADDVFSVAILRLIYPNVKIMRTRDVKELEKADLRIDVGGKYNPETGDYDHHQADFKLKRENAVPYSSVGLIWKHFGNEAVKNKWIFDYLDRTLFQFLDANDSGMDIYKEVIVEPYTISSVIGSFEPSRASGQEEYNLQFQEALNFAFKLLKNEIKNAELIYNAKDVLMRAIKESKSKDYVVLENKIEWYELAIGTNLKFVVDKSTSGDWGAGAVRETIHSFKSKIYFPTSWRGLFGEDLAKITGVKDVVFCHKSGAFAAAKTKEGAIKLVEIALKHDKVS